MPEISPEKISNWIKTKVKNSKTKGIVLGLSGGIDSSVVSVLCKNAVGRKNLLCLILPCETSKKDIQDAKLVAKKFKLKTKTVDLTNIYRNLLKILPPANKIAKANLKPRLRMLTLYYFANKHNYLVVGTGNKSEIMMGYFTKYGDGGVDILPIGDLLKKDVLQLAKKLKIPERIINKEPSAGLWPGQTDEKEMGITYKMLDKLLEGKLKNSKIKNIIKMTEHKRKPPEIFKMTGGN